MAAALAARHIGGAVNYVGVAETLDMGSAAQAAGLAADNLLCALYFATVFHLARHIPPDIETASDAKQDGETSSNGPPKKADIRVNIL